jgi:hypothetical protein
MKGFCEVCVFLRERSGQSPICGVYDQPLSSDIKDMCIQDGAKYVTKLRAEYREGQSAMQELLALAEALPPLWHKEFPTSPASEAAVKIINSLKETNDDLRDVQKVSNQKVMKLLEEIESLRDAEGWKYSEGAARYLNGLIYAAYYLQGKDPTGHFVEAPGDAATSDEQGTETIDAQPMPHVSAEPYTPKTPGEIRLTYEGPVDPIAEWLLRWIERGGNNGGT